VLRRWRSYWACVNPCYNAIDRTVWDGNQILVELRQDGSDLLSPAQLETDRGGAAGVSQRYYGAVAYTHGGGIDQPLDLIRYDYDTPWGSPIAIIPHNNWRGEPDLGSYANGTARSLKTLPNGTRDSLRVDWPSKTALATHRLLGTFGYRGWFGSLVTEQRDGSGQMYMRNRYYDPATGRFTQEDPIGLAGGVNAYGFAAGDPVNFSDPFGLCPTCGDQAVVYWAKLANNSSGAVHVAAMVAGGLAALWTSDTYKKTSIVLAAAGGAAIADAVYAARTSSTQSTIPQAAEDMADYVNQKGSAPPGYRGGSTFANDGRGGSAVLPKADSNGNAITYREWDVNPRGPGGRDAERVVTGSDGKSYYTDDHYQRFSEIQ
jgi:RHS repeat-associated protein